MDVVKKLSYASLGIAAISVAYLYVRRESIMKDLNTPGHDNSNINAMLGVIKWAEGTDNDKGYNTIYSYHYFTDFSRHPNRKVCAGGYCSTAAGAYQFLYTTWLEERAKLGLKDFSPQSQDLAAVSRFKYRGVYNLVKSGRILEALDKLSYEWASLPASNGQGRYGQPIRSVQAVLNKFQSLGGQLA